MAAGIAITGGVTAHGAVAGDKEVVQRTTAQGAGDVQISGTFTDITGDPKVIEARVVLDGGSTEVTQWAPLSQQVVGDGVWSGKLPESRVIDVSSASAASPCAITLASNHGYPTGVTFPVTLSGVTGGSPVNPDGELTATSTGTNTFTVAVDTSTTAPTVTGAQVTIGEACPIGGWYNFDLRLKDGDGTVLHTDDTSTAKWGVGIVVALAGQSNMNRVCTVGDGLLTPDAKTSCYLVSGVRSGASATSASQWIDLGGGATYEQGNGLITFLNNLQSAVASAIADVPVAAINVAIDGSALVPECNYVSAGYWDDAGNESGTFHTRIGHIETATGLRNIEAVVWQQGEAEATTVNILGTLITSDRYYSAFERLHAAFVRELNSYYGDTALLVSGPGRLFSASGGNSTASVSGRSFVQDAQLRYAHDNNLGYVFTGDIEVHEGLTPSDYGLHWEQAGCVAYGTRAAQVLRAVRGFNSSGLVTRGPRITRAEFGTESAPTSRTKMTLHVEHEDATPVSVTISSISAHATAPVVTVASELLPSSATFEVTHSGTNSSPDGDGVFTATRTSATTYTISADTSGGAANTGTTVVPKSLQLPQQDETTADYSNQLFEVVDEHGGLFVLAGSSGVVVHPDGDKIELTLERDTTNMDADFPDEALPNVLSGNYATVAYLSAAGQQDGPDAEEVYMITDNSSTQKQKLLPTFGYLANTSRDRPTLFKFVDKPAGQALRALSRQPAYEFGWIKAKITAVNVASNLYTLEVKSDWTVSGSVHDPEIPLPGMRGHFQTSIGLYMDTFTVRKVETWTKETQVAVIEISHDLTGQSSSSPDHIPAADDYVFLRRAWTAGGILASARDGWGP